MTIELEEVTSNEELDQLYQACLEITSQGVQALQALNANSALPTDSALLWTFTKFQDQIGALGTLNEVVNKCRSSLLTALQNAQVEQAAASRRIKLMQHKIAEAEVNLHLHNPHRHTRLTHTHTQMQI